MRFIVVDIDNELGVGDEDRVLGAVRMIKGVRSADWGEIDGPTSGAYHRCRRSYRAYVIKALDEADAFLRGPDGGVILPPRPPRFKD